SPALSCISFRRPPSRPTSGAPAALVIGRKAAQERFSEESFRIRTSLLQLHRKRISQKLDRRFAAQLPRTDSTQQAWMNSRNSITIASERKHRQPIFLHPTNSIGRDPART